MNINELIAVTVGAGGLVILVAAFILLRPRKGVAGRWLAFSLLGFALVLSAISIWLGSGTASRVAGVAAIITALLGLLLMILAAIRLAGRDGRARKASSR